MRAALALSTWPEEPRRSDTSTCGHEPPLLGSCTCRAVCEVSGPGLDLQAAASLVRLAERSSSEIWIECDGRRVSGTSILGVLSLFARKGALLTILAEGDDADEAVKELASFVAEGCPTFSRKPRELGRSARGEPASFTKGDVHVISGPGGR